MLPEQGHKWFTSWLPVAQQAGPFLTVGMAVVMVVTIWWMNGWLNVCIERNQLMATQLVSQQKEFHAEVMLRLAHCPPPR